MVAGAASRGGGKGGIGLAETAAVVTVRRRPWYGVDNWAEADILRKNHGHYRQY